MISDDIIAPSEVTQVYKMTNRNVAKLSKVVFLLRASVQLLSNIDYIFLYEEDERKAFQFGQFNMPFAESPWHN